MRRRREAYLLGHSNLTVYITSMYGEWTSNDDVGEEREEERVRRLKMPNSALQSRLLIQ